MAESFLDASFFLNLLAEFIMQSFVTHNSIVRRIWGRSDSILFIFAGAAAEFALNKAVDWLYFTGRLPADPLGRLFSTVTYARKIVFSSHDDAMAAIDQITSIHKHIEQARDASIPDWAYRDVLYMLIYYSIASYELLYRRLTVAEKEEVYNVFHLVGSRMGLNGLPANYHDWTKDRIVHLKQDLSRSSYSIDLFRQYRKHLGAVRYRVLLEGQKLVVPEQVKELLGWKRPSLLKITVPVYKALRKLRMDHTLKYVLIPRAYKDQVRELDIA